MKEIEQLEAAVGKKVEQWNAKDLQVLAEKQDSEMLQLFKNPIVLNECITRSKGNTDVEDILYPLSIKLLMTDAENKGNDLLIELEKKEIDEKGLISGCESMMSDKDYYKHLAAYLILINKCPDYDLKIHEDSIRSDIASLKEIICAFSSGDSFLSLYSLISDLMELIFSLRAGYFQKYSVDILDDADHRLEDVIDLMTKTGQEAIKAAQSAADGIDKNGSSGEEKPGGEQKK